MCFSIFKKSSAATLVIFFIFAYGNALASTKEAQEFVENVSKGAMAIITSNANQPQKESQLTALFIKSVDTKWIGKFAMGKYWRDATEAEQEKYIALHRKFLVSSYVPKFKEYTDQEIKINRVNSEGSDEYIVETQIVSKDGPPIRVDYKLHKVEGQFMIFDVIAEGVSLITTQRADFSSVLSREGVGGLIDLLGKRV